MLFWFDAVIVQVVQALELKVQAALTPSEFVQSTPPSTVPGWDSEVNMKATPGLLSLSGPPLPLPVQPRARLLDAFILQAIRAHEL